jgi:hypothetical protein
MGVSKACIMLLEAVGKVLGKVADCELTSLLPRDLLHTALVIMAQCHAPQVWQSEEMDTIESREDRVRGGGPWS